MEKSRKQLKHFPINDPSIVDFLFESTVPLNGTGDNYYQIIGYSPDMEKNPDRALICIQIYDKKNQQTQKPVHVLKHNHLDDFIIN